MDVHLTKAFISEIPPEELLLLWADYKATCIRKPLCQWRASPTQLVGGLVTAFLVMTSESPNILGHMGQDMSPGSPANSVVYADAAHRIATPGHLSFPPCTSGYELRIAPAHAGFCPGVCLLFAAPLLCLVPHL